MAKQDKRPEAERYREHLQSEVDAAALYHTLADAERDARRASVLHQLAEIEERHAQHWVEKLRELGEPVTTMPRAGWYTKLLGLLARRFGARSVLPIARAMEIREQGKYAAEPAGVGLVADERRHAQTVVAMTANEAASGAEHILGRESWHRTGGGGSLRAAIFGVSDGLGSNFSLVMGVAGANPPARFILLSGIAGLLAGAFSMAAGEYISMKAQRELFERQIALEREELESNPEEEREELALIYQAKGLPKEVAETVATRLISDKSVALDTLAREELGLNPDELGSPVGAALSSFGMFAIGAIIPVLPFIFGGGSTAIIISIILGVIALFAVGAALSVFTGRNPLFSGGRQLVIGIAAAAITFLIGRLIGVSVS